MSEKIKAHHQERKAVLYIRQSSAHQVTHNQESRALQYAMKDRLKALGFERIDVIDEDLGRSAAGTVERSGFERMVAEVCMGEVGAVAAREVSRFARNSREWQRLVEVCRVVDTVLVDQETVYSARQGNDRLLLGLKGSLNEYELDLFRQRSLEARYAKARRGELIVAAPVGFLKTEDQRLEKDPDRRVQETIELVFHKFLEHGTIRQTFLWFLEKEVKLPARKQSGELQWKRPSYGMVQTILTNPAYGGAYAYGKSERVVQYENGQPRTKSRRKPREQWMVLKPNAHEGFISWEEFERIQKLISQNRNFAGQAGAAKSGSALLTGLLRCRKCGRKLRVYYTGRDHDILRYSCHRGALDLGEPRCITFGGWLADEMVGQELMRVVQPAAIQAAILASQQAASQKNEALEALKRELESAQYAVNRARRQYDAIDPENRLVADELERRWNQALVHVRDLEARIDSAVKTAPGNVATLEDFEQLAVNLREVWNAPEADPRLKKRIVRTLIQEIIADVDAEAGEIILIIHWRGGVHTELKLPRRRRRQSNHTPKDIVEAVRVLAKICTDKVIAGYLNRNGLRTGRDNRWSSQYVNSMRNKHGIPCYSEEKRAMENWMNLTEAARYLKISSRTLRLAAMSGEIAGEHPLADGPWVFQLKDLESEAAKNLVWRTRVHFGPPALPHPEQQNLSF